MKISAFVFLLIIGCGGSGGDISDTPESMAPTSVPIVLQHSWKPGESIDLKIITETDFLISQGRFGKDTKTKSILIEFLPDDSSVDQLVRWTTVSPEPEFSNSFVFALEPAVVEFYLDQSGTITRMPLWETYRSGIEQAFIDLHDEGIKAGWKDQQLDLFTDLGNNTLASMASESDFISSMGSDAIFYFSHWYRTYHQGDTSIISVPSLLPGSPPKASNGSLTLINYDPVTGRGIINFAQSESLTDSLDDMYAALFVGITLPTDESQAIIDSTFKGDFTVNSVITANFNVGFIESIVTDSTSEIYADDELVSAETIHTIWTATPRTGSR